MHRPVLWIRPIYRLLPSALPQPMVSRRIFRARAPAPPTLRFVRAKATTRRCPTCCPLLCRMTFMPNCAVCIPNRSFHGKAANPGMWCCTARSPQRQTDIDWARKRLVLRESTQAAESAGDTPRAMHWTVRAQDLTLRRTLMRWAAQAGWQVSWDIRVDYPVQLEGAFSGSFTDAVEQFANALRHSDYPLLVCLYEANQVVRVLHYGDRKQCDA